MKVISEGILPNTLDLMFHSAGNNLTNGDANSQKFNENTYKLFYAAEGSAVMLTDSKKYKIEPGGSFLVFPFQRFSIFNESNVEYYWLEFSGIKATAILSQTAFRITLPIAGKIPVPSFADYFKQFEPLSENMATQYRNSGNILILLSYYVEHFPGGTGRSNNYVDNARRFIEKNFRNPSISVTTVAEHIKVDRTYLYRLFKDETGLSISQYINKYRISRAERLMLDQSLTIKDIAYSVGFSDQLYFSKVFKKLTGKTPTEFRKSAGAYNSSRV